MKYYAIIDTNVLVSAMLKWDSVPGSIIELALDGPIVPVVNEEILQEYQQVLSRPRFHLSDMIVRDIIDSLTECAVVIEGQPLNIELPDPKDRVFYEVVMDARSAEDEDAYLVTGNMKHFPVAPFIVTPREMLDIILSD